MCAGNLKLITAFNIENMILDLYVINQNIVFQRNDQYLSSCKYQIHGYTNDCKEIWLAWGIERHEITISKVWDKNGFQLLTIIVNQLSEELNKFNKIKNEL